MTGNGALTPHGAFTPHTPLRAWNAEPPLQLMLLWRANLAPFIRKMHSPPPYKLRSTCHMRARDDCVHPRPCTHVLKSCCLCAADVVLGSKLVHADADANVVVFTPRVDLHHSPPNSACCSPVFIKHFLHT